MKLKWNSLAEENSKSMTKISFWQRNERIQKKFQIFINLQDVFHVMQTIKLQTSESGLSTIKTIISKFWTTKRLYTILPEIIIYSQWKRQNKNKISRKSKNIKEVEEISIS